jgi:hypothetical protein
MDKKQKQKMEVNELDVSWMSQVPKKRCIEIWCLSADAG